jgi:excisionase family DNA binding protein
MHLWTAKEVAAYLGVKPVTVYAWVKEQRIPHIILSRGKRKKCVRFRVEAIERWVAQREHRPRRKLGTGEDDPAYTPDDATVGQRRPA